MKALDKLSTMDKAKLLHSLFPQEIKYSLNHIYKYCEDLRLNPDKYSKDWSTHSIMTFKFYKELGEQVEATITRHYSALLKYGGTYSVKLFYGVKAAFVITNLVKYAKTESENEKFKMAVALLFLDG